MRDVFVLGTGLTPFRRWPDRTHRALAEEAIARAVEDAGLADLRELSQVWFGNCDLHLHGQPNLRGQATLGALLQRGVLPEGVPISNVEGGCATGALAFQAAAREVGSGESELALAVGVEKLFFPDAPAKALGLLEGGLDRLHPEEGQALYARVAAELGLAYAPHPGRSVLLDVCALEVAWHMARYGTTARQIAACAAKNRGHATRNPNAQLQKPATADEILADKPVVGSLTRSMCAPVSDGAAAVLVASGRLVERLGGAARRRAVQVRACAARSGRYRAPDEPSSLARAAGAAYARAGLGPADVQVAEVHDATAFAELLAYEALGFCEPGRGGALLDSGATAQGGARPVNLSGGLVGKGHPLAATGLAMVDELTRQLRGEAEARQAAGARVGLLANGGGLTGFDPAACVVALLEASG